MEKSRNCARCGEAFAAGPWSARELCDACARTAAAELSPRLASPAPAGGDGPGGRPAAAWFATPASAAKAGARTPAGDGADEAEEILVVEEEVPLARADALLRAAAPPAPEGAPATAPLRDFGFWLVLTMGVMPLLIGGVDDPVHRLTGLLFFFALLWGAVFQAMVLRGRPTPLIQYLAFFFTGTVGLFLLYTLYAWLPAAYLRLTLSDRALPLLLGQIFQVGLCEEACKLVPAAVYLLLKKRGARADTAILIGVYSGLGFAAFENIQYSQAMLMAAAQDVYHAGAISGHAAAMLAGENGVYQIIGSLLLRIFSLVFLHAVFSGISAGLLAAGGLRRLPLALAAPAFLHGMYNWLSQVSTVPAGLVIAASFFYFAANLRRVSATLA